MSAPQETPHVQPLRHDKPIALRLTDSDRLRTITLAHTEGRSASNFARQMFLRGLAEFEREQAPARH